MHAMLIEETQELGLLCFLQGPRQFMKLKECFSDNESVYLIHCTIFILKQASH